MLFGSHLQKIMHGVFDSNVNMPCTTDWVERHQALPSIAHAYSYTVETRPPKEQQKKN